MKILRKKLSERGSNLSRSRQRDDGSSTTPIKKVPTSEPSRALQGRRKPFYWHIRNQVENLYKIDSDRLGLSPKASFQFETFPREGRSQYCIQVFRSFQSVMATSKDIQYL